MLPMAASITADKALQIGSAVDPVMFAKRSCVTQAARSMLIAGVVVGVTTDTVMVLLGELALTVVTPPGAEAPGRSDRHQFRCRSIRARPSRRGRFLERRPRRSPGAAWAANAVIAHWTAFLTRTLLAFVVSVVAEAAKATPPVLVVLVAQDPAELAVSPVSAGSWVHATEPETSVNVGWVSVATPAAEIADTNSCATAAAVMLSETVPVPVIGLGEIHDPGVAGGDRETAARAAPARVAAVHHAHGRRKSRWCWCIAPAPDIHDSSAVEAPSPRWPSHRRCRTRSHRQ